MTPPEPDTEARPERPTLLWGVSLASSGVFLVTWALLWLNAYAINDDLPNTCQNVRRQSFPPEVTCASMDGGMVTGGSAGWLEALFFASFVVTVLTTTMAVATAMATRKR
ncbi:hypothetical protein ACWEF9_03515 [Streptomyces sp. NPDC004980]